MDSNPTSQVIEQNIVDLLGLQDDYELSWEDYFRALREAAVTARMNESKYSSEDAQKITEELKRVKGVKKETVFKTSRRKKQVKRDPVDPTKVTNISKFVNNNKKRSTDNNIKPKKSLIGTKTYTKSTESEKESVEDQTKKTEPKSDSLLSVLKNIDKTVGSILTTLENQLAFQKKSADYNRRSAERRRGESKEDEMESVSSEKKDTPIIIKAAEKALSPLQQLFQRIKNFLFWMFAAKAFKMFSEWFSDPNNQKKVVDIIMFLRDHWVLLVGSWLAFGTSIGRFITRFTVKLGVWTAKMAVVIAKKLIPLIGKLGPKGKIAALAGLGLGAVAIGKSLIPGEKPSSEETETPPKVEVPTPPSEPTQKFEKGGIAGSIGKAFEYSPLGLTLKAGKFGAENLGKAASGVKEGVGKSLEYSPLGLLFKAGKIGFENLQKTTEFVSSGVSKTAGGAFKGIGGLALNALKYSPIGLGYSLGKKGLETVANVSSNLNSLPILASLSGLGGVGSILGSGLLKDSKVKDQFNKATKEVKTSGLDKDPKFIQMGGLPGLTDLILQKTGPEVEKQSKDAAKTRSFNIGGVVDKISSGDGIPITGAGKDDTLIKANVGDAILTEKDQSLLMKAMSGASIGGALGGPIGALTGGAISSLSGSSSKVGNPTTIAVKKGEAILSPDVQQSIYNKFGINIPAWLSKRKPQKVDSDNIKTKGGKSLPGFSNGGIIHGFSNGGIAGGTPVLDLGRKISGDPNHKFDPVLAQSIPLLYRMLQTGRFKDKGWGDKKFMDQLTARLLVESKNFSRSREMYDSDSRDPKGKEGYNYFASMYTGVNGNKNADDAYNFRGRGAIQLTGRENYEGFNKWLARNGHKGIDVEKNPDLLATNPKIQALSTLYYLEAREKLFKVNFADMAKRGDSEAFTYNINGGYNHLAETQDNLKRIQGLSGGVNYGTGFAPAAPKPTQVPQQRPRQTNPIMDIASRAMTSIGNFFSPPAAAAPKPAAPKPAASKPKRWAIDPRGWIGKQGGGIIKGATRFASGAFNNLLNLISQPAAAATNKRTPSQQLKLAGNLIQVKPISDPGDIDTSLPSLRRYAEHKLQSRSGVQGLQGGGVVKKQDGGLVDLQNSINQSTQQYKNQPSNDKETSLGIPLIRNNPLQSLKTIRDFGVGSLDFMLGAPVNILHEASQMVPGMKGGGIVKGIKGAVGNAIGNLFGKKPRKRDVAKKVVGKTTGSGSKIKEGYSESTGKKAKEKKGGIFTNIYEKLDKLKSGISTAIAIAPKRGLKKITKAVTSNPRAIKASAALAKYGGRMVPGLGVATSAAESASRAEKGDKFGAALAGIGAAAGATTLATSGASLTGVGAAIPAIAEGVSMVADTGLLAKDLIDITFGTDESQKSNELENEKRLLKSKGIGDNPAKIAKRQGGGFVNIGNGRLNIQNPDTYLRNRYGIDVTTPRQQQRNLGSDDPFVNFGMGMRSLGRRANDLFSPLTNLFRRKKKKPRVTETSRKIERGSTSFSPNGLIKENTGLDISGATADKQLTALQPGEYVIPKDSVDRLGKGFFDHIVASTDSNSSPAKEGLRNNAFTNPIDLGLNLPNFKSNYDLNNVKNNASLAFNPNLNLNIKKKPSISDTLNELRSMRANSLERQGRLGEAYGLRAFGTGMNFSPILKNSFDNSLNKSSVYDLNKVKNNTNIAFNLKNLTAPLTTPATKVEPTPPIKVKPTQSSSSVLDPTKTAASMPHVYAAARAARERARAEGLPPEEVEKRVIEASIKAKEEGPKKSFMSQIDWLALFDKKKTEQKNDQKDSMISNQSPSVNLNKVNPFNTDLGLNIPNLKTNYNFNKVKNNTSLAFNPNLNLNLKKKQSIDETLNELRGMRANSLERQGKIGDAIGLRGFNTGMDFSSLFTKGLVMENSGFDISGATADRQFTALQPGEYVIPKDSVDRLGKGFFDNIVGSTDSNSAPAKLGKTLNTIGQKIKPYQKSSEGKGGIVKLPPIKSGGSNSGGGGQKAGQKEVMFDPLCTNPSAVTERQRIQDTYGIVSPF